MRSLALALLMFVAGCSLYFDDGGDDDCKLYPAQDLSIAVYRNPATGLCEGFGGGCDDPCGACAAIELDPLPDWGACFSTCDELREGECLDAPGCIAAYLEPARVPPGSAPMFQGCWAIAPSGPAPGRCDNLDAYECSRHDNCSAIYAEQLGPDDAPIGMAFERCAAEEPDACGGACGDGTHCEQQCSGCDPTGMNCDACRPVCVPDDDACNAIYCPEGYECGVVCDEDDPTDPACGTCHVACVPSTQCEALPDEATCAARADCSAVYDGMSCSCDASGHCTCQILTYERCEQR